MRAPQTASANARPAIAAQPYVRIGRKVRPAITTVATRPITTCDELLVSAAVAAAAAIRLATPSIWLECSRLSTGAGQPANEHRNDRPLERRSQKCVVPHRTVDDNERVECRERTREKSDHPSSNPHTDRGDGCHE